MDLEATLKQLLRVASEPVDSALELAPPVRLSRHVLHLPDGHRIGVAVAGRGVPFVVAHGFGVESLLYAQPLARLAALGFRVIAIDVAGHGDTAPFDGLPSFADYVDLLDRAIAHLGIRHAVLAGHSMGGRIVAEVAARSPGVAIGVVLLDAIVGEPWEWLRTVLRFVPPALAAYGTVFLADTIGTVPLLADTRQAMKLGSRAGRTVEHHVTRPWRALAPSRAILRAPSATPSLEALRRHGTVAVVVHGDRDLMVPFAAGRDAAARLQAELVRVHGGGHSWLLRCPETLPAIIGALLDGRLGSARDAVLYEAGLDPSDATAAEMEAACVSADALERALGADRDEITLPSRRHLPRFRFSIARPAA